ncbi:predicted protein [Naegleria gruberi]|uniref:Predicted protein n=1 Tax=Naegleria gruberi TaxID=5762 RepID=D2V6F4_NAEGR|nr:uncharacterized protein NAEGRDRAFT_64416 [Naegleria gruberi]EFC47437.1 predicted protein [Naegleria gruberi]|eukprot:XP_002680181.1 predicted protein [Naegleria gruberi strain NEG-M]
MTSSVQPSTPPLGATGVDETTPLFESTLLIEDQDNLLMSDLKNNQESALFETIDKDNIDSNFTIEANTSGGVDFDANIFNDEEFGNLASAFTTETKEEEQVAKSPILIEVPSNANFFNMKSSQEYTIEEDQPFLETFEMHQEKLEQEEKPSDVAPFTDASESSFMAGTSNLNDKMDMAPPTRLKFSVEGSYTSSSTTDPLTSFTAPSISIMEADDNPFSLTSPQDFSSNVSSNGSTSGFSNNHSARSSDNSPPSKSVKTENKSSASQRLERDDDLSGYTSDSCESTSIGKSQRFVYYFNGSTGLG